MSKSNNSKSKNDNNRKSEVAILEKVIADIRPILPVLGWPVQSSHRRNGPTIANAEDTSFDWKGLPLNSESEGPSIAVGNGRVVFQGTKLFIICEDTDHPENVGRFVAVTYDGRIYPHDSSRDWWKGGSGVLVDGRDDRFPRLEIYPRRHLQKPFRSRQSRSKR